MFKTLAKLFQLFQSYLKKVLFSQNAKDTELKQDDVSNSPNSHSNSLVTQFFSVQAKITKTSANNQLSAGNPDKVVDVYVPISKPGAKRKSVKYNPTPLPFVTNGCSSRSYPAKKGSNAREYQKHSRFNPTIKF